MKLSWLDDDTEGKRMRALVHLPGEGEHIGGRSAVTIKATGEDTVGSFYLGEAVIEPGFAGPPLHVPERLHDMVYVLEGMLTMRLAEETVDLGPGSFVLNGANIAVGSNGWGGSEAWPSPSYTSPCAVKPCCQN